MIFIYFHPTSFGVSGSGSSGGGGSGGRLAIYYLDNTYNGDIVAYGGSSSFEPGAAGTVYMESKVMMPPYRSLRVDNNGQKIRSVSKRHSQF